MQREKRTKSSDAEETTLDKKLYERLFVNRYGTGQDSQLLEQPTVYELVETVTTYGAYEDPI